MGNGLPSLPFFTSDFLIAVALWPTERIGAYCLALFHQWEHGSVPADDPHALGLLMHCSPVKARRLWNEIASKFHTEGGEARNLRLEEHRKEVQAKVDKGHDRGVKGARAKWHKQRLGTAQASAQAMPKQSVSNANQSQSQNQSQEEHIRRGAPDDADRLAGLWNEVTQPPIPRCSKVTAKRRKAINARLAERPMSELAIVFDRINASSFCRGELGGTWIADFDWAMKPETAVKVLEGKYDDRKPTAKPTPRAVLGLVTDPDQDDYHAMREQSLARQRAEKAVPTPQTAQRETA